MIGVGIGVDAVVPSLVRAKFELKFNPECLQGQSSQVPERLKEERHVVVVEEGTCECCAELKVGDVRVDPGGGYVGEGNGDGDRGCVVEGGGGGGDEGGTGVVCTVDGKEGGWIGGSELH